MQKFFKQLLQFLSRWLRPKSSHILLIRMKVRKNDFSDLKQSDVSRYNQSIYSEHLNNKMVKTKTTNKNALNVGEGGKQQLKKKGNRGKTEPKHTVKKQQDDKFISTQNGKLRQIFPTKQHVQQTNRNKLVKKANNKNPVSDKKITKQNGNKTNHKIPQERKQSDSQKLGSLMKLIGIKQQQIICEICKSLQALQYKKGKQINQQKIRKKITESLERLLNQILTIQKNNLLIRQPPQKINRQPIRRQQQSSNLFCCNILNEEENYKLSLIETISNNFGEIRKTNFLYHQDNLNQNNMHRYIDGKRNIAIIIQTVDDHFVALFTQPAFQRRQQKGKGLIIGLSSHRVYKNLPDKCPIIYDQAYVIFGNADVRIGDKQIHTQFGSPTSYYDCKGDKASVLFGHGGKKDFQIKYLQIFQVIF